MEPTVADKLKEIQDLATLARQKRKELEAQVSKLSQERLTYLQLAEERKNQIRELSDGLKQLPSVRVGNLASAVLAALQGPGAKTMREICNITGLQNGPVSQCLLGLVRRGKVKRILPEGRMRGADFILAEDWAESLKKHHRKIEIPMPEIAGKADISRSTFGSDKFVPPKASKTDKKLIDLSIQTSKKAN